MPKIYKQNCKQCGKYYERPGAKYFCSLKCANDNPDRKDRLRKINLGRKHTEEAKKKIGLATKGNKYNLGRKATEETKTKMSLSHKGFKHTEETRKKISIIVKQAFAEGKRKVKKGKYNYFFNKHFEGENNYLWKGEDVGYIGLHAWIKRKLGNPTKCEFCNKDGLKGRKIHWANKSRKYKRELDDWLRLCVPCHKNYDLNKIKYER